MQPPKVFISYSHDSLEHQKWVLELATNMRNNGIDAILDQWDLTIGDDLAHFMELNLTRADYIIMVCTLSYVTKANKGEGGVGYEKMIITSKLIKKINSSIIIPLVRQSENYELPTFLNSKLFIDFSNDSIYKLNFDRLLRKIHNSPQSPKPPIGSNPFAEIKRNNSSQPDNSKFALIDPKSEWKSLGKKIKHALWVDDVQENNYYERLDFNALGVTFELASSTEDALQKISSSNYDAVISDMSRPEGNQAGFDLLVLIRENDITTPFFVYDSSNTPEDKYKARKMGAQGLTNDPEELFQLISNYDLSLTTF